MIEYVNEVKVSLVDCLVSDEMVAMAAWVSHDTDSEERLADKDGMGKLINFLYKNKHMSPFEHGIFIFRVDVPLFVAREWHRHRTMSYNEVSGRYTEMKPRFYVAPRERPLVQEGKPGNYTFVPGDDDQYALTTTQQRYAINTAWAAYKNQLDAGVAKEVARDILPLSLMTQFYVTVNPRNLMQFLTLRNDKHALYEIRQAAVQMDEIFAEKMPLTWKAFHRFQSEPKDLGENLGIRVTNQYAGLATEYADEMERVAKDSKTQQVKRQQAAESLELVNAASGKHRVANTYATGGIINATSTDIKTSAPRHRADVPVDSPTAYTININVNEGVDVNEILARTMEKIRATEGKRARR